MWLRVLKFVSADLQPERETSPKSFCHQSDAILRVWCFTQSNTGFWVSYALYCERKFLQMLANRKSSENETVSVPVHIASVLEIPQLMSSRLPRWEYAHGYDAWLSLVIERYINFYLGRHALQGEPHENKTNLA